MRFCVGQVADESVLVDQSGFTALGGDVRQFGYKGTASSTNDDYVLGEVGSAVWEGVTSIVGDSGTVREDVDWALVEDSERVCSKVGNGSVGSTMDNCALEGDYSAIEKNARLSFDRKNEN